MGIFDQMTKQALGKAVANAAGVNQSPVIGALIPLVMGSGGVSGLIDKFQSQGMGSVINSWISTGPNQPIGENQIESVFGRQQLESAAQSSGIGYNDLLSQTSNILPQFIDKLTPDGEAPKRSLGADDLLKTGLDLFGKKN